MDNNELKKTDLARNLKRRFRQQDGFVVKHQDGFYIRYYADSNGGRRKVTVRLCDLDTDPAKVDLLRASHMSAVNNARHSEINSASAAPVLTVGAFWDLKYEPWMRENKRFSTARGYAYDWKLYVAPELQTRPIDTFTTVDACNLLDYMVKVKNLNKSTLAHVKSLCSGIFSRACALGVIKVNPWREASVSVKVRKAKPRIAYTPAETTAILRALDTPDARLFFSLVAVMGMRPSEAAACRWENLSGSIYHVREAAPYGQLGGLKTERSMRDLQLVEPVIALLKAWRKASGNVKTGLMFTTPDGGPVDHNSFSRQHIAPLAKKACPRWCGLYAGRHGAATSLYALTGDIRASYQILGNSLEVVMSTYVKPDVSAGKKGMGKYEAALKKSSRRK